ncbi:VOC family protein [Kamptonema cortianum]|nr:VOC family protein [Kamptonema cortianum]
MAAFDQFITFIYTPDMQAARHFYEDVLELELALDQGLCRIYRISRSGYLGLCQRDDAPSGRDQSIIICLVTDDVDGWYQRLVDKGITSFEKRPAHYEKFSIYHFMLRDPHGYLVEIQRFVPPSSLP